MLKQPPLAPDDFKSCFRTYSDADPEQHLAFDLYRIQAQEALKVNKYNMTILKQSLTASVRVRESFPISL